MDRIEAIRRSLRCFVLGLLGLIPVIGIPTAFLARREFVTVRRGYAGQWNPARSYLLWGAAFAYLTISLFWAVIGVLVLLVIANLAL